MLQTSAMPTLMQRFRNSIDRIILETIEKEREEFIAASVKEYEQKLRSTLGKVAINMTEWYSMNLEGNKIILEVRLDKNGG